MPCQLSQENTVPWFLGLGWAPTSAWSSCYASLVCLLIMPPTVFSPRFLKPSYLHAPCHTSIPIELYFISWGHRNTDMGTNLYFHQNTYKTMSTSPYTLPPTCKRRWCDSATISVPQSLYPRFYSPACLLKDFMTVLIVSPLNLQYWLPAGSVPSVSKYYLGYLNL